LYIDKLVPKEYGIIHDKLSSVTLLRNY